MKFAKSLLIGTGTVTVAGLILTLLAPRAAHAVAALMVQVTNTATNPALTSGIDDPGRIAYQSTLSMNTCGGEHYCFFTFGSVPLGHRLVVQHMSGQFFLSSTPPYMVVNAGPNSSPSITQLQLPVSSSTFSTIFDAPSQFYVDAGGLPVVQAAAPFGNPTFAALYQTVSVSGYLLDCNAAPCAPIASF